MIRSWYRSAVLPRRDIARLLPSAGTGLVVGLVVLARTGGTWYLIAWCQTRVGLRWFRLGRILRADLTPEQYEPRSVADVGEAPPDARPVSARASD